MKIYLHNPNNFHPETIDFYKKHFELTDEENAELIVLNDFELVKADKPVACNSTGIDHIKAPEIISLRGEDLSELTGVAELTICMAGYLTRIFKKEELKGKSILILGFGRIGRQVAKFAIKFGMYPFVVDKDNLNELGNLLKNVDIISLHITADEENRNFIDRKRFEQIKDGAIFLNPSRPWLTDRDAFKRMLDNKLAGAWEDFETELKHPKLITTPHLGGYPHRRETEFLIAKKLLKLYG